MLADKHSKYDVLIITKDATSDGDRIDANLPNHGYIIHATYQKSNFLLVLTHSQSFPTFLLLK